MELIRCRNVDNKAVVHTARNFPITISHFVILLTRSVSRVPLSFSPTITSSAGRKPAVMVNKIIKKGKKPPIIEPASLVFDETVKPDNLRGLIIS
ncbi:MAG: hypothetical protein BWY64_01491 [bacterium ADurb.Bin363]|nr:MAG: hypothetical protein BWY64_01491 [bacterium ADurb.Bin363]